MRRAAALFTAAQTYSEVKETSSGHRRADSDIYPPARNIRRRRFSPSSLPPPDPPRLTERHDVTAALASPRRRPERRRSAPSEGHAATCQEAAGGPFRSGEVTRPVPRCWGQRGCCASAATPKLMHDGPPFYGAEFEGHEGETPPSETGIKGE